MADVLLVESNGQVWLVAGDEHLNEVLLGRLPDGISVEYRTVDSRAEVFALWEALSPEAADGAMPWTINPALVPRLRGLALPGERSVAFAAWSVALDDAAQAVLADAALWLAADPGRGLVLRQRAAATPAPGQDDVQRLRGQLVLGALVRAGADAGRVSQEHAAAEAGSDPERLDIIEVPGAPGQPPG